MTVKLDFQNILMRNFNTRTYSKTHHVFIMLNFYLEMVLNPNEWTDFQTVNASESFQEHQKSLYHLPLSWQPDGKPVSPIGKPMSPIGKPASQIGKPVSPEGRPAADSFLSKFGVLEVEKVFSNWTNLFTSQVTIPVSIRQIFPSQLSLSKDMAHGES